MRSRCFAVLLAALAMPWPAAPLPAQTPLVAPAGLANQGGNGDNSLPFNSWQDVRVQFVYDSSTFTSQGASQRLMITRLRYRADNAPDSWAGGTYPQVQIDLSTCPNDFRLVGGTFATNHGADRNTVFQGPVVLQPGSSGLLQPGPWYIDIPLATPFVYDPVGGGDLCVDIRLHASGYTGGFRPNLDSVRGGSPPPLGSRVYDNFTGSANGTLGNVDIDHVAVCEFTWQPAVGLSAAFIASSTSGGSPLPVQFSDRSFSSDAAGITAWAWDFDGDSIVDSTLQNPAFTFGCGSHDVTLTVSDPSHGSDTLTRRGYVVVDRIDVDFAMTPLAGNVVQFGEQTGNRATGWAWDLDGDGNVDATVANPSWAYPPGCIAATVSLSAWRGCGPPSTARKILLVPSGVLSTFYSGMLFVDEPPMHLFDVDVTHPLGIEVAALAINAIGASVGAPFEVDVYVTPGSFQGSDTDPSRWRRCGTARGLTASMNTPSAAVLDRPFYLPAGIYGMALVVRGATAGFTAGIAGGNTFANQHLRLILGATRTQPWGGTLTLQRVWNGTLCYDVPDGAGRAGIGFYGLGCAGTLPAATLSPGGPPRFGSSMQLTVDGLPANVMLGVLGLDRRNSALGALPLELTPLGAPGCFARVRPDLLVFVAGSNGTAVWSLAIPNSAALAAQPFFVQPLVFDAAANALGAVTGDAWAGVLGR